MKIRFPKDCINCSAFRSWESGIMEISCKCQLTGAICEADCDITVNCPKGGAVND